MNITKAFSKFNKFYPYEIELFLKPLKNRGKTGNPHLLSLTVLSHVTDATLHLSLFSLPFSHLFRSRFPHLYILFFLFLCYWFSLV